MSEETRRILEMVAAGKITVDEGERLIAALGGAQAARQAPQVAAQRPAPRFLVMEAGASGKDGRDEGFRMRVPLDLVRAGMKMRALVPEARRDRISRKLREKGFEEDIFEMSDDRIDAFIRSLGELELEAGDGDGSFRLFLE